MIRAARTIRFVAFGLMAAYATLATLFAAGYAFEDPGGLAAVGLVAAMIVPMLVLVVVARRRPVTATWLLAGTLVVLTVCWAWAGVDPQSFRDLMDRTGPVLGITAFVIGLPMAALGLRRPGVAGLLLLVLAVVPYVAFLVSIRDEEWQGLAASLTTSSTITSAPTLLVGLLFLLASLLARLAAPMVSSPTVPAQREPTSEERIASEGARPDR